MSKKAFVGVSAARQGGFSSHVLPAPVEIGGACPEAAVYISAVESADGQPLEQSVRDAITEFVCGCKSDGNLSAMKASCILAGARTLEGALVPLKGTAPINYEFVAEDYDRKTGLIGNGDDKWLDSNRKSNADPRGSHHLAVYRTAVGVIGVNNGVECLIGDKNADGSTTIRANLIRIRRPEGFGNGTFWFSRFHSLAAVIGSVSELGLIAINRTGNQSAEIIAGSFFDPPVVTTVEAGFGSATSLEPTNDDFNIGIFGTGLFYPFINGRLCTGSRLSFYSIGETIDLTKLNNRITAFMNALDSAL